MKAFRTILIFVMAASLLAIAIVGWLFYAGSNFTATLPAGATNYTIDALALNITILQMVMGSVAVILAFLGFIGYTTIKTEAVAQAKKAAEKEARRTVSEQLQKMATLQGQVESGLDESPGTYGIDDRPVEDAAPAANE